MTDWDKVVRGTRSLRTEHVVSVCFQKHFTLKPINKIHCNQLTLGEQLFSEDLRCLLENISKQTALWKVRESLLTGQWFVVRYANLTFDEEWQDESWYWKRARIPVCTLLIATMLSDSLIPVWLSLNDFSKNNRQICKRHGNTPERLVEVISGMKWTYAYSTFKFVFE